MFGTPFGNAPRNGQSDAITNIANASLYKRFKLGEHASFEFHATALNVFNHMNFQSVDPFVEDAPRPMDRTALLEQVLVILA